MADSNLRRLTVELSKESPVNAHFHQRAPSAPVSMASSDESSHSRGEIQLQKSIEELRETEVDYVNDLWFILGRLAPEIKQKDRDLLFGGLDDIHEFSSGKNNCSICIFNLILMKASQINILFSDRF